jgi:hypothetical protein
MPQWAKKSLPVAKLTLAVATMPLVLSRSLCCPTLSARLVAIGPTQATPGQTLKKIKMENEKKKRKLKMKERFNKRLIFDIQIIKNTWINAGQLTFVRSFFLFFFVFHFTFVV